MNVAFIGLGIMGSRMAARLLQPGVSLTVYNRSPEPMQILAEKGATQADSAAQAVADADLVFTMLPTPNAIESVVSGPGGCLASMKKRALWIDCSTVDPLFSRRSAQLAGEHDLRFLDAPVAGTKPHAEQGSLVFMVGGDSDDLETARTLLLHMGTRVVHVGPAGAGTSFKMLVNNMLAQSMATFAETLALGRALGLDRDFLLDTLPGLPVAAPFLQAKAELIRREDFSAQFPLEWMHKDLYLVGQTAYALKQPMPLAGLTRELYAKADQQGSGRDDFAAIYRLLAGFDGTGQS